MNAMQSENARQQLLTNCTHNLLLPQHVCCTAVPSTTGLHQATNGRMKDDEGWRTNMRNVEVGRREDERRGRMMKDGMMKGEERPRKDGKCGGVMKHLMAPP